MIHWLPLLLVLKGSDTFPLSPHFIHGLTNQDLNWECVCGLTHTHMNGWLDGSDEGWLEGRSLHSLFLFSFIVWSVSVPPSRISSTNRHTQSRAGQGLWNQSDSWKWPGRLWVTAPHLYINIVLWRFSSRIHLKIRLFCGTACSVNMFAHTPSLQCCAKVLSQAHSSLFPLEHEKRVQTLTF